MLIILSIILVLLIAALIVVKVRQRNVTFGSTKERKDQPTPDDVRQRAVEGQRAQALRDDVKSSAMNPNGGRPPLS